MRPFIVYWNNIPAPYMVERFNALADRGGLDFEAWFSDRVKAHRSWEVDETQWRFNYRYMPTTRIGSQVFHWPCKLLQRRPDVLVSLYAEPSFLLGWVIAKACGVKTAFWVEVTFDRWVVRTRTKELFKKWLFPKVDAILTVGRDGKKFAEEYGATEDQIFFAPHVIDVSHYEDGAGYIRPQRDFLRKQLKLKGTTFIYVGRLWWGKGVNYLLNAFELVQQQNAEPVSLLLVGDGPEEARLREICTERGICNVIFAGFKQKSELPPYYALADVFVFPTLGDPYGLVVDEAMACSLPIISTSAAGEILERVEEGVNGYIVPPEDAAALAERMLHLARSARLRTRMGHISAEKIQGHTPERWAKGFENIIKKILIE